MLFIKFLLGLAGLGIVVFVHELGHFLVARLVGIKVTAFSLGWGPALLHKTVGGVDYRLSVFPVGGYCKMEGEGEFQRAWEENTQGVKQTPGSFYGVSPQRRMAAVAAGPIFNLIFAMFVFSVLLSGGNEYRSLPARIVLAKDISGESYPADRAGFETGDTIVAINGKPAENYHKVQEMVGLNAKKALRFTVLRDGQELSLVVEPELERSTGAGKIGVYFWTDPIIAELTPGGAAERAGLEPGDRVIEWGGQPFPYTAALSKIYGDAELPAEVPLVYERGAERHEALLRIDPAAPAKIGITWEHTVYKTPPAGFFGSIGQGVSRALRTLGASARSLTMLFRGVDITKALSGPVRISYMVGDIATEGFAQSPLSAVRVFFEFIALISIALALMNLLPLPIVDGGMLVIFFIECFARRPLHPRLFSVFQMAGIVLIGGIMLIALYSDIMFFVSKP